jgi:6-pyruvoyltetrahydropterin/6-carboxytetrahydropterin synthase
VAFAAAHRYFRPDWSSEKNAEEFGKCANEHGHGHSYECHVTVSGVPDPDTSMVMSLSQLDELLREEVWERFDHRHLNHDIPEFAFGLQIPTAEALAMHTWQRIEPRLPAGVRLECVRIQEDPTLFAEFRGEQ